MGKVFSDFFCGASFVFRGLGFFLRNRSLWKYGLFPFLVTTFLYIAGGWALLVCSSGMVRKIHAWCAEQSSWISIVVYPGAFLIHLLTMGFFLLLIVFCSGTVYELSSGPFQDALIRKTGLLRETGQAENPPPQSVKFLLKIMGESLFYNLQSLLLFIVFFLAGSLIPGGWIAASLLMGYRYGVINFAIPGFSYGKDLQWSKGSARKHKALLTGFGVIVYLIYFIPLLVVFFLPGIYCGSTLLFAKLREEENIF